jgi:hypothetical protein
LSSHRRKPHIEAARGIRLDLGCGRFKHELAIGIDREAHEGVDLVHDLTVAPWPLPDGAAHTVVRVRVRRTAGPTSGTSQIYYLTSGHGESASYRKDQAVTWVLDEWRTLEFDMVALTLGGIS